MEGIGGNGAGGKVGLGRASVLNGVMRLDVLGWFRALGVHRNLMGF